MGKQDAALAAVDDAIERWEGLADDYQDIFAFQRALASCYRRVEVAVRGVGRTKEADALHGRWKQQLLKNPQVASAVEWGKIGQYRFKAGLWESSRQAFEKSIELRKEEAPTSRKGPRWWYLAVALDRLGETERARSYYEQLVEELEHDPPAYYDASVYRDEAAELLGIEVETEEESSGEPSAENGIGT
jgi:tetratricopeptide (TPR) repeat protein